MFGKKNYEVLYQSGRSYIAETMQVEGDIHCEGAVDIAGLVSGNVYVSEMMVFDTGSVKGNLHVNKIEVNGHVEGEIVADVISLGKSAVIKGDLLFKTSLRTEEGADIEGYIKRVPKKKRTSSSEEREIQDILPKTEVTRPVLVKGSDKKEAV